MDCDDARTVVQQARAVLAAPPAPIDAAKFAAATIDWLDPHGLWSVAPDTPAGAAIRRLASRLVADLEAPPQHGPCAAALSLGRDLAKWTKELRGVFDRAALAAMVHPSTADLNAAFRIASRTPFEDGVITQSARALATELGRQAGTLRAVYGPSVLPFTAAVRARVVPDLDAEGWSRVVVAAALRAYVPQLDAHGAWAPLEEELSIYDLALEAAPPTHLWAERDRTVLGARIERGALAPLADGDVVLKVGEVILAGMSVEQIEQLSVLTDSRPSKRTQVTVLRANHPTPIELSVLAPAAEVDGVAAPSDLAVEFIRYGDGEAARVQIPDVPDDLGARLSVALDRARATRDLRGILLDLRANGGGSTDGAIAAIGLFLPGVSLFPMRRRDGGMEVERAPEVAAEKVWNGPLAVLVDGDSASAAEMIAGGLGSYHRALVVGDRTYGKGCAQEYLDDEAHVGVLRLTTLLFSLPDGSPVQKTGVVPNLRLSLPAANEHEASLPRAMGPWRGPDVRDMSRVREVPWANHGGRVGPCEDPTVCRALRAVGAAPAAAR
jgi:carboxyl-terminal processing protease